MKTDAEARMARFLSYDLLSAQNSYSSHKDEEETHLEQCNPGYTMSQHYEHLLQSPNFMKPLINTPRNAKA